MISIQTPKTRIATHASGLRYQQRDANVLRVTSAVKANMSFKFDKANSINDQYISETQTKSNVVERNRHFTWRYNLHGRRELVPVPKCDSISNNLCDMKTIKSTPMNSSRKQATAEKRGTGGPIKDVKHSPSKWRYNLHGRREPVNISSAVPGTNGISSSVKRMRKFNSISTSCGKFVTPKPADEATRKIGIRWTSLNNAKNISVSKSIGNSSTVKKSFILTKFVKTENSTNKKIVSSSTSAKKSVPKLDKSGVVEESNDKAAEYKTSVEIRTPEQNFVISDVGVSKSLYGYDNKSVDYGKRVPFFSAGGLRLSRPRETGSDHVERTPTQKFITQSGCRRSLFPDKFSSACSTKTNEQTTSAHLNLFVGCRRSLFPDKFSSACSTKTKEHTTSTQLTPVDCRRSLFGRTFDELNSESKNRILDQSIIFEDIEFLSNDESDNSTTSRKISDLNKENILKESVEIIIKKNDRTESEICLKDVKELNGKSRNNDYDTMCGNGDQKAKSAIRSVSFLLVGEKSKIETSKIKSMRKITKSRRELINDIGDKVKRLSIRSKPACDYTDVTGVKMLFQKYRTPLNDYSQVDDIEWIFKTGQDDDNDRNGSNIDNASKLMAKDKLSARPRRLSISSLNGKVTILRNGNSENDVNEMKKDEVFDGDYNLNKENSSKFPYGGDDGGKTIEQKFNKKETIRNNEKKLNGRRINKKNVRTSISKENSDDIVKRKPVHRKNDDGKEMKVSVLGNRDLNVNSDKNRLNRNVETANRNRIKYDVDFKKMKDRLKTLETMPTVVERDQNEKDFTRNLKHQEAKEQKRVALDDCTLEKEIKMFHNTALSEDGQPPIEKSPRYQLRPRNFIRLSEDGQPPIEKSPRYQLRPRNFIRLSEDGSHGQPPIEKSQRYELRPKNSIRIKN